MRACIDDNSYIGQKNSYRRMKIDKENLEELLMSCQVFPKFQNYMIGFGYRTRESEIGPPSIAFRPLRNNIDIEGFECAYILRYIELTNRTKANPWSLRQYAVYHNYLRSPERPCSAWILLGLWERARTVLENHAEDGHDLKSEHPFEVHLLFVDVAISSWRPYLVYIHDQVMDLSYCAAGTTPNPHPDNFVTVEADDYQKLKRLEDHVTDVLICLDSTTDTLSTFSTMIHQILRSPKIDVDIVAVLIGEKLKETNYLRQRAESILLKIRNTRSVISSLLEHRTGHDLNRQMEALQSIEKEAKNENAIMRELAEKASRDSSSVRILTMITLIYLPFTVVSLLFNAIRASGCKRRKCAICAGLLDFLCCFPSIDVLYNYCLVYLGAL
ncbi:unnamed protein product [Periconia digitata]|uniref:CorA-like transporter domain-containing protein n=1 Tax=Periconia digitata TaxID=1303443 RepID=A0A9W4UNF5_9PLEO|nr:unnamed protein product [Periconia digitata]